MLNIAICDDDKNDLKDIFNRLKIHIKNNNIEARIEEFQSGADLIESSNKKLFDIIFLDIYMKDSDGIETALKIREKDSNCKIIFLTSSRAHGVLSYEVKASYYLLKPVDDEKLYNAFTIAIESIESLKSKYLVLKNNNEFSKLFFNDILYVESSARILKVYTEKNDIITVYKKLNDFEVELSDLRFFRCHKSFLVNLDFVVEAEESCFIMKTGKKIPISNSFKNKKKIYIDYLVSKL